MTTVKIKIWLALFIIGAFQTYYLNAEVRIVCYYTNWSVYRPGTAKFNPQNINPYLCTHLIYAFGGFTKDNTLKPFDKYQDIEKGGYAKFTGLKTYNKNLKTLIAIGGWNEGSSRFSSLSASSEKRKEFVKNVVKFLRVNHFDGLDLDWEYPSFRDGGKPHDKENYCQLVQELREEFEREAAKTGRPKLLLTMAVPAGIEYIKKGFDVEKLNKYLDWMNILSYDYHSAFEPSVNHHAPLYPLEEDNEYNYDAELNIDHTIKYYLENGADRQKLVLGIPTYGRSYTLFNPDANELGAPADGPGEMGDATKEKGYLAYYEICENINSNSGWTVVQPNPSAMGPYAYKDDQWVGYDDENIVRLKAKYVAEQDLGGIMFWSIDNDDFRGKCHGRPYPLIEAAKEALIESSSNLITSEERVVTRSRTRPSTSKNIESSEIVQNSGGRQTITQTTVVRSRGSNRYNSRNQNQFDDGKESTTVIKGSNRRRVANSRSKQNQRRQSQRRSTTTSTTTTTTTTSAPLSVITPSYTTPPPPATPDSGSDFKCEDEGFFPHPSDCKKYYWCLSSGPSELGIVAHQFTCPAGLYFNKAADSCDYSRNVLCNKKPKTTTTTTSTTTAQPKTVQSTTTPRTTTQRTRAPITAATSKTTLRQASSTTTTPIPDIYEDDEYEYYDDEEEDGGTKQVFDSEEDPKVIKELIALIKKVGGVQELEKQLFSADGSSGSTTPPAISKSLYERVLSSRNNNAAGAQFSGGSRNIIGTTKTRTTNFRNGVQFSGSEEESSNRGKPQYVTINRSRQRTTTNDDESLENSRTNTNFNSEERLIQTDSSSNSQLPSYVTIARGTKTKVTETRTSEESPNEAVLRVKEQRRNQFRSNSEMPEYVTIARGTSRVQQNENVDTAEDDSSDEEELNVKTTFNSGSERRFVNRLETVKNVNMPEYVSTTNFRQRNLPDTSSELNINGNEDSQTIFSSSESSNLSKQNSETSTSKYQTLNRSRSSFVSSSTASNQQTETSEEASAKTNTNSDQTLLLSIKDGQQNQKETVVVTVNESEKDVSDTEEEITGTTETVDVLLKPLLNIPVFSEETNQTSVEKTVIETETSTNDKTVPILQPARPFSITQKSVLDEQTNENASTTSTLKVSENQTTANDVVYTSRGTLLTPHGFVLGNNGSTSSNNNHINNITKIEYTIIDNKNTINYNLNETNELNKNNRVPIVRIASDNRFESRNTSRLGVGAQESKESSNETNVFNVSRNRFRIQGTSGLQSNQAESSTQSRLRSQNATELQSNQIETSSQNQFRVQGSSNKQSNQTETSNSRFGIQGTSSLELNQTETLTQNRLRSQNATELQSSQIETSSQNRFRVQGASNRQSNQAETSRNRFGIRESSNVSQNRFRAQETSTEAQNQTETVTRNRFTGRRVVSRFRTTTTTPSPSSETTRSRNRGRVRGTLATTTESIDDDDLNASVERTYRPKSTFRDLSSLTAVDFNRRQELNGNNRFRISRRRPARVNVATTTINATESGTSVNRTSTFGTRRQSISNENDSTRRTITSETTQDTASRNYLFRPRGNRILAVKLNETETQSEETQTNEENVTEITSTDELSTITSVNEASIEHEENEQIHLSETNISETESIGRDVNQIVKPIEIPRRRKIIRKQRPIASTIDFTTETNELIMVDNVDARVSVTREQSVTEPNTIVRTRKIIRRLRPVNAIQNTELEQKNSTLISNNNSSNSNSSENLVTQQRSQTSRFTSQRNRTFNRPTQAETTFNRPTPTEGTVTVQNTSRRRYQSNNFNRFGTRPRLEVLRTSSSLNSEITRNNFDDTTSKSSDSKVTEEESISQAKLVSNSETNQNISEESASQSISSNTETRNNFEARSQLSTSSNSETTRLNEASSQSLLSASQIDTSSKQVEEYENQRFITTENEKADATTDITIDDVTTDLLSEITTAGEDIIVTTANENDGLTSPVAITTDDYATTLNTFEEDESVTSNQNETSTEQTTSTTTSKPSRLFRRPGERTSLNRTSFSNRRDSVISTSSESTRQNGFRRRFTTSRPTTTVTYPSTTRRRTVYRQFTPRTSTRSYTFGNRRRNQSNEVVEQNEADEYNSVNSNDQEASVNLSSSRNAEESYSISSQERTAQNDRLNKVSITANQERVISQINSGNSGTRLFSKQNEYSEVNTKSTDEIGTTELNTEDQLNVDFNQNSYVENELLSKQNDEEIELTTSNFEANRANNTNQQEISGGFKYTSESNFGSSQTEAAESNTEITEKASSVLRKSTSGSNVASSKTLTQDSNVEISEETNYGLKKSTSGSNVASSQTATRGSSVGITEGTNYGLKKSTSGSNVASSQTATRGSNADITEETNYVLKKSTGGSNIASSETAMRDSNVDITEETNYGLKKSTSGSNVASSQTATGGSSVDTNEETNYVLKKSTSGSNVASSQTATRGSNVGITEETNYGLKKSSSGIKTSQLEKTSSDFLTEASITSGSITNEEQTSSLGVGYSKFSKNQASSSLNSNENSEESSLLIHHVFAEPTTEYPETTRIDFIEEDGIKKNLKKLIEVNRYVEVNYKEDDAKNKTIKFGTMLDTPEIDKIGEINRVTVIKIVDGNITQTGDENLFFSETSALRNFLNSTRPVTITTKIRASNKTVEHTTQNETVTDLLTAHLQAIENALVNDDAKNGRKIRIDSHSKVANTYTLMPDFTEITTLALEALFPKDKLPTTTTSIDNEIQTPLPTLKQIVTSDNQPNESQSNLLNIKILKQDEEGSRSLKFSDDTNILPIRILNDKPMINDETKVVYLLKNSPFIDSGIKRENRSPQKGLNIKSDKMGGFLTTTKSTTLSNVPYFRKNLLRRNQTTSILKKRPIANETTTTELPTTTVNQSLQKLRNRTFKPRPNGNLSNNKLNNTTTRPLSNVASTTTTKPNTNRFRFATRKVPAFRSTTQKISSSTERNDQDIEPSNHKSLNSKNLLDPETVVADDIVLAIHNIQAAPIRTSVEVNRNPKNIRYRPTTVRSLPKTRLKTTEQLPIIEDDVEYVEDDTETIKILGKDISKGKVLIHPSGKIQCLDQGNFPHPVSCRKFISCAKMENGAVIGWEYTCPKNLSFDPIGGICNWAAGLGCVS